MGRALLIAALGSLMWALPAAADSSFPEVSGPTTPEMQDRLPFDRPGRFGLGLDLNDFGLGVTGKVYLPGPFAVESTLGFGYAWAPVGFLFNVDFLYEGHRFYSAPRLSANWYAGVGGTVGTGSCGTLCGTAAYAGAQIVLGAALQSRELPFEAALEFRPTILDLSNAGAYGIFWGWWGFSLACRYFFG